VLGIVCFCVLLYLVARRLYQKQRNVTDVWACWLGIGLIASVTGHLVDLEFSFDVVATSVTFWLILALSVVAPNDELRVIAEDQPHHWKQWLPYTPALALVALTIGTISIRPLAADIALRESQLDTRPLAERIRAGERTIELWPIEPEYHLRLAWLYFDNGTIGKAMSEIDTADRQSPDNPRIAATRGDMVARASRYSQAEVAYRLAVSIAPNIAAYHAALGWTLDHESRREQAADELKRAVELDATDAAAYRALADVYASRGRQSDAAWAQKEAERWSKK
jgi:tetratricopeptide (TPR) repeat protein